MVIKGNNPFQFARNRYICPGVKRVQRDFLDSLWNETRFVVNSKSWGENSSAKNVLLFLRLFGFFFRTLGESDWKSVARRSKQ